MTDDKNPDQGRTPSMRDRMKPVEFVGISAVLALFVGLIVLMSTREPVLALIFFGVAFIVTLVVLALFVLGMKPDADEKRDLAEQNHELTDGTDRDAGGDAPGAAPRNPHD
ncbi:hypothetical protein [Humibacter ginsenosidimutans]|uniref:hypothetical protein n=1 Tax=Humibacter ginsenosidimutans TaxID=2599293 RepID=UPI001FEE4452|nr:hypothetical protein [Humibacter ginsenosidimutans]